MPHLKLVVRGVQVESVTTNLGTEDHGHMVEIAGEMLELEIRRDNLRSNLIISRDKFEHCIGGQENGIKYKVRDTKTWNKNTWYYCDCPNHCYNQHWHKHKPHNSAQARKLST